MITPEDWSGWQAGPSVTKLSIVMVDDWGRVQFRGFTDREPTYLEQQESHPVVFQLVWPPQSRKYLPGVVGYGPSCRRSAIQPRAIGSLKSGLSKRLA